jgi:manganese/iron transport system substrate-binding protein
VIFLTNSETQSQCQLSARSCLIALLLSALVVAALSACGSSDDATGGEARVQAVTTLPLFAGMVAAVGGQRVDVSSVAPAGADPHTFEPGPKDVQRVAAAGIAFGNGLGLEPGAEKIIEANLKGGAQYIKLGEKAKEHGVKVIDDNPHLWLDIENARLYAQIIRDALTAVDGAGAAAYQQNYDAYAKQLDAAASYARDKVASIPPNNRKLVTTHDAFPYLARFLGLDIVAFAEEGPGQESSPQDVADLTVALKDQGVPAVFTEPQIEGANKILESAASDAGVQVCTLYSDSLDGRVQTYLDLARFNAGELARCLGGSSGS